MSLGIVAKGVGTIDLCSNETLADPVVGGVLFDSVRDFQRGLLQVNVAETFCG